MNKENALAFFQACEEGKGWEACQTYCTSNATFSAQAEPLKDMKTLKEYVHFMQSMYTPLPDAGYEIQSISTNEDVSHVTVFAIFTGTHTGEGGPVPPTGRSLQTDYVYVMEVAAGKIHHMTKIWNSETAFKQIGWQA